jgi:Carboxypeptidase regulatory-like domain
MRSAFFFVGFIVSVSVVAQTLTEHTRDPQSAVCEGDTGVALRVIDPNGATIGNARVVVRDEDGSAILSGNTNQDGLLWLPRLANRAFVFSVSAQGFKDFHRSLFVSPTQPTPIVIALRDLCGAPNINCDDFTGPPVIIEVIQPDIVAIEPYPIIEKPATRKPTVFRRLLARIRQLL